MTFQPAAMLGLDCYATRQIENMPLFGDLSHLSHQDITLHAFIIINIVREGSESLRKLLHNK